MSPGGLKRHKSTDLGEINSSGPAKTLGDSISLSLLKFIRPEKKFDSLETLKSQIARDKAEAEKLLGEL